MTSTGQQALIRAVSALGRPYRWGARGSERFDCAGLVEWAYQLGRDVCAASCHTASRPVRPGDEAPGDLVFPLRSDRRVTHIALYIGSDHSDPAHRCMVIEAGGGDQTTTTDERATAQGACVRYASWARLACEVRRWT